MKYANLLLAYAAVACVVLLVLIVLTFVASGRLGSRLGPAIDQLNAADAEVEAANAVLRPLEEQQRLTRAELDPKQTVELSAQVQLAQADYNAAEERRKALETEVISLREEREGILLRLVPLIVLLLLHAFGAAYFNSRRHAPA